MQPVLETLEKKFMKGWFRLLCVPALVNITLQRYSEKCVGRDDSIFAFSSTKTVPVFILQFGHVTLMCHDI